MANQIATVKDKMNLIPSRSDQSGAAVSHGCLLDVNITCQKTDKL